MKLQHVSLLFVLNRIFTKYLRTELCEGGKITKWLIFWILYWPVRSNKVSPHPLLNHSVLGSNAVFCIALLHDSLSHLSPRLRIAHSHWSSYHRAIFHISHIRSPYLSSSAGARHAKLIQASNTCAEFSDQRLRPYEMRIDFMRYSVFTCNRIGLIPFPITQEMTWK